MNAASSPGRNGRFYFLMGLAMAALVLLGFARSYYLAPWFEGPPLTWKLHLHGAAMTLWLLLFLAQAKLIAAGRRRLHMNLGYAGLALAAVAIASAYAAALETIDTRGAFGGLTIVDRLYSNVLLNAIFGAFVGLGVAFRKRPEVHKRLMLLATITVIAPALVRAAVLLLGPGVVTDPHIPVMAALVAVGVIYDWRTRGKPHWVLLSGGLLLIALQLTRRAVGGSAAWAEVGNWLIA
jgi:hypothetical protein